MRRLTASGSRAIRDIDAAIGRQPCGRGEQAGGLDGLGEGHRRQDGGEPPGQHGLARPGRANEEDIMGRTPAYRFASPMSLRMPTDSLLNLLVKQPNEYGAMS
jgi:hypothetical protein